MTSLRSSAWLLTAVVLFLLAQPALPVRAQSNPSFDALDVVFVVDQSGSMFGTASQSATDPDGLRFQALQYAMDWLDGFQAQQATRDNSLDMNVSVVYFGDNARTLPLDTGDSATTWAALNTIDSATINSNLTEDYYNEISPADPGNTNFLGAMRQALEHFDGLSDSDETHLRVILLLTDGKPCAPTESHWSESFNNCRRGNPEEAEHMRLVEELIDRQFNNTNEQVYAVIIDDDNDFWPSFEDDWQSITNNNATRLPAFGQLAFTFNQILSGVGQRLLPDDISTGIQLGIPLATPGGGADAILSGPDELTPYYVSPYQQLMRVTLFKAQDDTRLQLFDPTGNPVTGAMVNVRVTGTGSPIEVWVIENPAPGDWRFGATYGANSQADRFASLSLDLIQAGVDYSVVTETPKMYQPLRARLSLQGEEGRPLPLYDEPAYQLQGTLTVIAPSGTRETIPLSAGTRQPGRYEVSFIPREAGEHTLVFDARSGRDDEVSFSNSLNPLQPTIQPVRLQLNGLSERVLEDIPQTVTLQVLDDDRDISDNLPLTEFTLRFVPVSDGNCSTIPPDAPAFSSENLADLAVEFSLSEVQRYEVCVTIGLSDSTRSGETIALAENTPADQVSARIASATLDVAPVQLLAVDVRRPVSVLSFEQAPQYTITERDTLPTLDRDRFPFLHWQQPDLRLEMAIVSRENPDETVPLADALPADTLAALFTDETVQLLNNNTLETVVTVDLQPVGGGSRWTADLPEDRLAAGEYTLIVQMPRQQLGDTAYAFAPDASRIETLLVIRPNWLSYLTFVGIWGGLLLLVGGSVFAIGERVTRPWRQQRNAPPGTLLIENQTTGQPVEQFRLAEYNSNDISIPLDKLPLIDPPLVGLEIQSDARTIQRKAVNVRVNVNGNIRTYQLFDGRDPMMLHENAMGEIFVIRYRIQTDDGSSS